MCQSETGSFTHSTMNSTFHQACSVLIFFPNMNNSARKYSAKLAKVLVLFQVALFYKTYEGASAEECKSRPVRAPSIITICWKSFYPSPETHF